MLHGLGAFALSFPLRGWEDLGGVPPAGSLLPQLKYCQPHVVFPTLQHRELSLSFVISFMQHALSVLLIMNFFISLLACFRLLLRTKGFSIFLRA